MPTFKMGRKLCPLFWPLWCLAPRRNEFFFSRKKPLQRVFLEVELLELWTFQTLQDINGINSNGDVVFDNALFGLSKRVSCWARPVGFSRACEKGESGLAPTQARDCFATVSTRRLLDSHEHMRKGKRQVCAMVGVSAPGTAFDFSRAREKKGV